MQANHKPGRAATAAILLLAAAAADRLNGGGGSAMFHKMFSAASAASSRRPHPPGPSGVAAASAYDFLDSMGINLHVDQGYAPASYLQPLKFTGIRQVRDGARNIASDIELHQSTGVRFAISSAGDLDGLLAAGRTLARAGALLALEGANEPNNFPITYKGERSGPASWLPVAGFQRDLHAAVQSDPLLKRYPVFGTSESGAEADNVGLQFLTVPPGAKTLLPPGTRFSEYANIHNYVIGNGNIYGNNQAWNAADPELDARWDGLYTNIGVTWRKHFQGYATDRLPGIPRVTTETGWDSVANPGGQHVQGAVLTNSYLAQFKRGWRYTFIYEMTDGEGGSGHQGLYSGSTPKLAATYIHNLTSILSDKAKLRKPGRLRYTIPNQPGTVHDLLLQKASGRFELVVWDERTSGQDAVTVQLGGRHRAVRIFDITRDTLPVQTLNNTRSIPLTLSDHAMILEIDG